MVHDDIRETSRKLKTILDNLDPIREKLRTEPNSVTLDELWTLRMTLTALEELSRLLELDLNREDRINQAIRKVEELISPQGV